MRESIVPKSDQINYDDFIGKTSMTIKITDVKGSGDAQQPVSIHYEGDNGKPYRPCKSMRRVLVHVWGADGKAYIGKSLTLYGDPEVVFAGQKVGGIRISHMSDINEKITMALSASKANKKPFTVLPMVIKKPELTPSYKGWEGAKNAIKAGTHTIDQLRDKYVISQENEELLKG